MEPSVLDLDIAYVSRFGPVPRSVYFDLDETRLHALEWGDKEAKPLLLVHGMRAHARWFTPVGPAFVDRYRVLSIDLRGHGQSAHTPPYGPNVYASDLVALIQSLAPQRPILLGHSMGGGVAAQAASRLGATLRGLLLIDAGLGTPPRYPFPPPDQARTLAERAPRRFASFEEGRARFRLRPGGTVAPRELIDHLARHALERCDDGMFRWRWDAALRQPAMMPPPRLALEGGSIRCPVQSIWGRHSPLLERIDPRDLGERFPSAAFTSVELIDDAHHHVFLDQPDAFNRVLRKQLDAIEAHGAAREH